MKKSNAPKKSLHLATEAIRTLDRVELHDVLGGLGWKTNPFGKGSPAPGTCLVLPDGD